MNNKCCVVLIIYKEKLTSNEERTIEQCLKVFGGKRDIKLVIPNSISTINYDKFNIGYVKVSPQWLNSITEYNRMCCSNEFYELFNDYDYILIYQTDCWVFEDRLDEFMELGYDWYGAPWTFWNNEVGNGGLSLRKVNKMLEITSKYQYSNKNNEDTWFCKIHKNEMNICPWEIAVNFSLETPSRCLLDTIKTIPMGLRGKKMFKLWDSDGKKFLEFKKSIKTAICCIGRKENQYAREFVEYYNNLGIDKIFIYDNNYDGEEHFEDVLQDYIDNDYVQIIDVRNKKNIQFDVYNHCYKIYGIEYDWMCFFDFDEFLILENHKTINKFLIQEKFKNYDCVLVNWMIMSDNGMVYNNHKPLLERFTQPIKYDTAITYDFPENNTIKSIIRCGGNVIFKTNPHVPSSNLHCCDSLGNGCDSSPFKKYTFKGAYLKHFSTKTIEEWLNVKMKRGYPDGNADWFKKNDAIAQFFKVNERTKEKINFIKKHYNELLDNLEGTKYNDNLDIFICTHKEFKPLVSNRTYKIINASKINGDVAENGLKGSFYSEILSYKYIAEKYPLKDYVGFCHYRKYWKFFDDIPNAEEILNEYDAIVAKPLIFKTSVREQYAILHNIEDLEIVGKIINEKYSEYYESYESFLKGNIFIPYNMFIMKKEDFKEYIEFIFGILDEYINIVGTDITKRIEDNKDKYLKSFYPNNTIEYQYRIGGYLGERLTNVFFINKFKKLKTYPVIITEDKYKNSYGKN